MHEVLTVAETWLKEGREIAIATVISTWGSAPLPIGSQLLIDERGNFEGSVSGGCVEGAVILEALDVMKSRKPKLLDYKVADDDAFAVGLACGGEIRIYVEPIEWSRE